MKKRIIDRININLEIVKKRKNFTEYKVEYALYEISKSCVELFFVKVLKDEGEFNFWKAVEDERLEKCFKPILLAKIKDTVRRYEKAQEIRKIKGFSAYYKDDLIEWSFDIACDAQRKISEFCQQT